MLNPTEIRTVGRMEIINDLVEQVNNGEIDLSHNFNPWQDKAKSLLIESLLIRIPLPSFYIDQTAEPSKMIDGYKRLATITSFINNEFALQELKYLPNLNGVNYSELNNVGMMGRGLQRRLKETRLQVYYVEQGTSAACLQNLYTRLRT